LRAPVTSKGVTLSDEQGQEERAPTRRYARLAAPTKSPLVPHANEQSGAPASRVRS
jgi:hypothetical protein